MAQHVELNRGRTEARAVARFAVSAEQVCFPQACQAALLQQAIDDPTKSQASFKEFFLLTVKCPAWLPNH